ncbi:putative inorganic phosphate cotransporter isoform X2 [Cylas formicarius]|uniref:putative inorganic phosphate cotransporter isoform X2 n=1 Tax=Cylas formicarius TaxID=197179 RepID=UPI00295868BF|nr:putative inorganic phosphate cotransporter isoform X2 [Cylas formicarius]
MLSGWKLTLSKMFLIPQRYVLGVMGFLAIINSYTMRVSISVAITEMVPPKNSSSHKSDICSYSDSGSSTTNSVTDGSKLYDWNESTQGLILSSFYWGYAGTQLLGGYLSERYGGKYTLGIGLLISAICTLITPWVIYGTDGNSGMLIFLRVVEGLGEGTTYPALNALLANWVPKQERGRIGALIYAGNQMGTIVSNLISGQLIEATRDWASVFFLFGSLGIVWFVLWQLLCYSDPDSHPFISESEKLYLRREVESVTLKKKKYIPWKKICTNMPVVALVAAQIGHDWGFYMMTTDLPKYMKGVLKFNVADNGIWSSIPYVSMYVISMFCGWFCDWLIRKDYLSVTMARKYFTTVASVGPAIFLVAASYSGCNRALSITMFTTAMGFMGAFYCGMKINALDLSPNYAATVMGIENTAGAITGIVTPYLAGVLTPDQTLTQWREVFWIAFGVFFATNIFYLIFASGEIQEFNNEKQSDDGGEK